MKKSHFKIVFICVASILLIAIACALIFQSGEMRFKKSLNGEVYYTTSSGKIMKYSFTEEKTEQIFQVGEYSVIDSCYYDRKTGFIYARIKKDNEAKLVILNSSKVEKTIDLPDEFDKIAVKDNFLYTLINTGNSIDLCRMNLQNQKISSIIELSDNSKIYNTSSERLYFTQSGVMFSYFDENKKYDCPISIANIIAGNDKGIVSYSFSDNRAIVYDTDEWKEKHSVKLDENPIGVAVSSDLKKMIYCVMDDKDKFAGNTDSFKIYKIVDFESGKSYKYKIGDEDRIREFFAWVKD